MITFAHDPITGDLDSSLTPLSGDEAIETVLENRVSLTRGEWFVDANAGLPWIEWASTKATRATTVAREVRKSIEALDFVQSADVTCRFDSNRVARIDARIVAVSGRVYTMKDFEPWRS